MSEPKRRPGHAFISYVREDAAAVDQLQRALESAGIEVWRDTTSLWPGEDWRMKIRQAITSNALVFIACFSHHSLARQISYQNKELTLAIDQMMLRPPDVPWLIPVRLSECDIPDRDIGGGRTLGSIQRADLFGNHREAGTERVVTTVLHLLGRNMHRSPDPDGPQESTASGTGDAQAPQQQAAPRGPRPGADRAWWPPGERMTSRRIEALLGNQDGPPTDANGPIGKVEEPPTR